MPDAVKRYSLLKVRYCCWQAERAVQDHNSQLQEELQVLKDAKHHHAEQQREQVGATFPMSMRVFTILRGSSSILIGSSSIPLLLTASQYTSLSHGCICLSSFSSALKQLVWRE